MLPNVTILLGFLDN